MNTVLQHEDRCVVWKKSQRKTMTLSIENTCITVKTSPMVPRQQVLRFLSQKNAWIEKQLQQQTYYPPRYLNAHETWLIHGKQRELLIQPDAIDQIHMNAHHITIHTTNNTFAHNKRLLEHHLKTQAMLFFKTSSASWQRKMNVHAQRITIRSFKRSWGNCSANGNIQFNWHLMMAPFFVRHYVVVHELSHLVHFNHSALFWKHVGHFFPRYPLAKHWLKRHAFQLKWIDKK